jgi:thiol:disulfide interchange protein DsbC
MGECDSSAIERNKAMAIKYKVNGTPAIVFEDGSRAPGAIPAAEVERRMTAKAPA